MSQKIYLFILFTILFLFTSCGQKQEVGTNVPTEGQKQSENPSSAEMTWSRTSTSEVDTEADKVAPIAISTKTDEGVSTKFVEPVKTKIDSSNTKKTEQNTLPIPPKINKVQPIQTPPKKENLPLPSISLGIKDFAYSNPKVNIKVGTKVTWKNYDSAPHTVTSDEWDLFSSKTLNTGESFSFTFTEVGTVKYYCTFHPMMKGEISVSK